MKTKPVVKVNKSLWNKLTEEQRKQWNIYYSEFLNELNLLSELHNSVKAFNLAFVAIWEKSQVIAKQS